MISNPNKSNPNECIPGKLYVCPGYYLLLYQTDSITDISIHPYHPEYIQSAPIMAASSDESAEYAQSVASAWAKTMNKNIVLIHPNDIFMCLKSDPQRFMRILCGTHVGYIIYRKWLDIQQLGPHTNSH